MMAGGAPLVLPCSDIDSCHMPKTGSVSVIPTKRLNRNQRRHKETKG